MSKNRGIQVTLTTHSAQSSRPSALFILGTCLFFHGQDHRHHHRPHRTSNNNILGPFAKKGAPLSRSSMSNYSTQCLVHCTHGFTMIPTLPLALCLKIQEILTKHKASNRKRTHGLWENYGKLCQIGYHKIGWLHPNRTIFKYPPASDQVQPG